MSVIVKGMEMPKSCASCRMAVCFADTGRAKCYATLSYIDPERGKRSYDCPLCPLPEKHGRLIDADRFDDSLGIEDSDIDMHFRLMECETIVEAEGE